MPIERPRRVPPAWVAEMFGTGGGAPAAPARPRVNFDYGPSSIRPGGVTKRPKLLEAWKDSFASTAARQGFDRAVADAREDLPDYNPFAAVAAHDPKALKTEGILYENKDVMVVLDRFSGSSVLVVPKKDETNFLIDASTSVRDQLEVAAQVTSDVFAQKSGRSEPADIWVSSPRSVEVRQLHVHVRANLRGLDDKTRRTVFEAVQQSLKAELDGEFKVQPEAYPLIPLPPEPERKPLAPRGRAAGPTLGPTDAERRARAAANFERMFGR